MDNVVAMPEVFTAKDIASMLGIGINQARALVYRNDFPSIQIGKRKFVPKAAFYEWLNDKAIGKRYVV